MFGALKLFYHNAARLLFQGAILSEARRGEPGPRRRAPGAVIVFLYGECQNRRLNYRARPYNAHSIAAR